MVKIPLRLDELLPASAIEKLFEVMQQPDISSKVRDAMHRVGLHESSPLDKVSKAWQQARTWLDSLSSEPNDAASGATTLNASGQLFSTALAGIPLAPAVAYGFAKGATVYQSASAALDKANSAAKHIFGNRACAWVSSPAEALRCVTHPSTPPAGVVLSRVDAVRVAGLGDIHSMLTSQGRTISEVGAANGVTPDDWQAALHSGGQIVVLVSPNNLPQAESAAHRQQAVKAAHACGAKVVELLADGSLCPKLTDQYGFPDPLQCLTEGVDALILPLNLLVGAPGGALVVGDNPWVGKVQRAAELSGAALGGAQLNAATLALQLSTLHSDADSGAAAQLLINTENLRNRARRIAIQLNGIGLIGSAVEHQSSIALGPSPWNRYHQQSWGVKLSPQQPSAESLGLLQRQLTRGEAKLGIHLLLAQHEDGLLMDLRFVPPQHDHELVALWGGGEQLDPAPSAPEVSDSPSSEEPATTN